MTITHELQQAIRALQLLRQEKAQELEQIDTSIRHMAALVSDMPDGSGDLEISTIYEGLSIPQAARAFLEEHGAPAQTAAIADALLAGGIRTTARNFATTVYSILREAKGFVRLTDGRGWGLVGRDELSVAGAAGAYVAPAVSLVGGVR